ncbi:MAG: dTDP-glucose 4,6-dehydratase [Anaerolineales bacterium]|nr:dTDP-glucose 4,6-dehydratase [Anaerolineales bacterium]
MQNVLVTGGAGFIGSNFIRYLLNQDPDVSIVNLDALTYAGSMENLGDLPGDGRHTFVQGNICNRELVSELLEKYQVDTIVHFAAETHVDRSILGPDVFVQTNVMGTFTLLDVARQFWLEMDAFSGQRVHFHHVSTDEVYGSLSPDDDDFSETTPYDPRSPYSASKAASDHFVRAYYHTYGLPVTLTNCSNNYGPYQFPEKLIPLMILNALNSKPLPIYGDGKQIRDWLYVIDHCEGIYRVLQNGRLGETYNIGGENQPFNIDLVQEICDYLDEIRPASDSYSSLITHVPDRPGHDRRYAMDISKINTELGWAPRYDLSAGIRKTVDWYLDNLDWVVAVMERGGLDDWINENYAKRGVK